jgi:hypothetical protein
MAGVGARTLQTLGNRRSLSMVERYSHLSSDHLLEAVEKLVRQPTQAPIELDANLTSLHDEGSRSGGGTRCKCS